MGNNMTSSKKSSLSGLTGQFRTYQRGINKSQEGISLLTPHASRLTLVLIFFVLFSAFMLGGVFGPKEAEAAITAIQNETNVYHSATLPGATAASFAVGGTAGARMLVVALTYQASSSASLTVTSVTYDGVPMTSVNGDLLTNLSMHTGLYYLKDNAVMDGTAKTLAVNITGGGTPVMNNIWYAVYDGVDQSASPITNSQNYNSGAGTVVSAAFATALTVNANDQAVLVGVGARATAAVTYTAPANWTVDDNQPVGTTGVGFVATRSIPGTNTTDTANFTVITGLPRWSQTGMSMKACYISTGTGNWNTAGTWSPSGPPPAGSTVVIAAGHTVTVDVNTNTMLNLTVNGTLDTTTHTVNGTGTLTVASTGTINVGANNFPSGFATNTLNAASTVDYYRGGGQTVSAQTYGNLIISGSGTKTLTTTGVITMTIAGSLNVTAGTFDLTDNSIIAGDLQGSGNITGKGGAGSITVGVDNTSTTFSGVIKDGSGGSTGLIKTGTGTLTLSGASTYTGVTTISNGVLSVATIGNGGVAGNLGQATSAAANLVLGGGTLQYTGATASTNRAFTLTAGTTSTIDVTTNTLTISGASAATTGALTKIGAGTLVLSGANNYTGLTTVSQGTLRYGTNNALSSGGVTVDGGSTFDIASYSDTVGPVILVDGTIAGTTGVLTGNPSYTVQNGSISAILGGGGVTLTKTTAGTVTMSGVNTYTGVTTINAGVLSVATIGNGGVAGNLGQANANAANLVLGSGTLQYTGATASTNRAFTLTAGTTSSIDVTTNNLTISGASANTTGALTKIGNGTLTLSGANTFSGGMRLSAGQLNINNATAIGSGAFTINGGTIDNTSGGVITLSNNNAQNWNGDFTFTGTNAINLGTGAVSMNANRQVTVTANTLTVGGTISEGSRNLTKAGAGTLSFGANTVTLNSLTISAGTLTSTSGTMNLAGDFTNNSTFTHNSGTVNFNGSGAQAIGGTTATTFNNLTSSGGGTKTLGNNAAVNGALVFTSGNIATGSNTLSLGGSASCAVTSGYVVGNLKKTYSSTGSFTFCVGDSGYSPVDVNVTATIGDFTVKAIKGQHPQYGGGAPGSGALQRYWTLTGTGQTANLTFYYIDPDDIEVTADESTYEIVKRDGSGWTAPGGSVNTGANTATISSVTSFSDWTLGATTPSSPTAVKLISFDAVEYDGGVLLEWRTGHEVKNLGFNIYRKTGGELKQVNSEIIAGSALIAGPNIAIAAGKPYTWLDNTATGKASYYLEDIDLSGKRTMYGPVTPVAAKSQQTPLIEQSATLSGLSDMHTARRDSTLKLKQRLSTASAIGIAHVELNAGLPPEQVQWHLAGAPAVKIFVQEEGWYRITQPELIAYGLGDVDPLYLQLYVNGRQIPMVVKGAGDRHLDPQDYIEFYGMGLDTPSTDTQTYWLVAAATKGLRVKTAFGGTRVPEPSNFAFTVEARPRELYAPAMPKNTEGDRFYGPIVFSKPAVVMLNVQHADVRAASRAMLDVTLQGIFNGAHNVDVILNGTKIGQVVFSNMDRGQATLQFTQQGLLQEGDNKLQLIARGGDMDFSLVDVVSLTYWHTYTADNDALRFTAHGGGKITVSGFSASDIRVMDITDPNTVWEVSRKVAAQGSAYAATFSVPFKGPRTLLAFNGKSILHPAAITSNNPSALHSTNNRADMVIIAHSSLKSALTPLKQFREGQGRSVAIIDVEDIYDEFSFGNKTPEAIQDFLLSAYTYWSGKPRFLLLTGDATVDPRDYLGYGLSDLVPTNLVDGVYSEAASDDLFADFNEDGLPEMAVGRIPAGAASEVTTVVSKIIGYEQAAVDSWTKKAVVVSDRGSSDVFDFEGGSDEIAEMIAPYMTTVKKIYRRDLSDARADLLNNIKAGALIVNYMGHGSEDTWGGNILVASDADSLTNGLKLPFFMNMTCWNGLFASPYVASLGEALLKTANGGAIAVWASSGLTDPDPQHVMNRQMITLLFNGTRPTLGEAAVQAKAATTDMDVRRTWILIGDPMTRLKQ